MEALGLFVVVVLAMVVVRSLMRPPPPPPAEEDGPDPAERLSAQLRGDPVRDRPVLNRILALGPGVVPGLIDEIASALKSPDDFDPRRHARLCEVIADFGLAAVGPVAGVLERLQPTAPLAPALTRILRRLGQPGAEAFFRRSFTHPGLAPYLPRFRWAPEGQNPATPALAALRGVPAAHRVQALDLMAGVIAAHPVVLDGLWHAWPPEGRGVLLRWMADWLPLARRELVVAGARDEDGEVRLAAARLATLLAGVDLRDTITELLNDPDPRVRRYAVVALSARDSDLGGLRAAARDPDATVAEAALIELVEAELPDLASALESAVGGRTAHPLIASQLDDDPITPLLDALEAPTERSRTLAARLLARHAPRDPRARERLIRLAESKRPADQVAAIDGLARVGDGETPELLARALRTPPESADALLRLQIAAQHLGESAVLPLARRLRPEPPGRLEATLAVLRAQPYADAIAPLLRGLEDVRSGQVEGLLSATIFAGGPQVRDAVYDSVQAPARGLLAPALRYLAAYASPADVPLLLRLFDHHLPLRSVLLCLIETQGLEARAPLRARVDAGGDDAMLVSLEQRLAILDAYLGG